MNPHKFSDLCIKKKQLQFKNQSIKSYVGIKYDKFHSNLFTWQWLTKYIFHQLIKNLQAPIFFSIVLHIFYPFAFQTYMSAIKKIHFLAKSVSNFF